MQIGLYFCAFFFDAVDAMDFMSCWEVVVSQYVGAVRISVSMRSAWRYM